MIPYGNDQPDDAARVERLGTSRTISRQQYTARNAIRELKELLENSQYANKAIETGHVLQAESGVKIACDEIIKLLDFTSNQHFK